MRESVPRWVAIRFNSTALDDQFQELPDPRERTLAAKRCAGQEEFIPNVQTLVIQFEMFCQIGQRFTERCHCHACDDFAIDRDTLFRQGGQDGCTDGRVGVK